MGRDGRPFICLTLNDQNALQVVQVKEVRGRLLRPVLDNEETGRATAAVSGPTIEFEHLAMEIRVQDPISFRPKRERRRTVADDLYKRMLDQRESFWAAVYPLYMEREITRGNVREVVRRGLEEARGNYKIVARLFNMESRDYKRFLNFLRKHDCQVPFKEYR